MRRLQLMFLILVTAGMTYAQEFSEDFQQGYERLMGVEEVRIDFRIKMMEGTQVISSSKAQVTKVGNDFLTNFDNQLTLVNEKGLLVIDQNEKLLDLQLNSKRVKKKYDDLFLQGPISIKSDSSSLKYVGTDEGLLHFSGPANQGDIQFVHYWLDEETKFISKITYVMGGNGTEDYIKAIVDFDYTMKLANEEIAQLSLENYLTKICKKEYAPSTSYATYQLTVHEN